MSGGRGAGDRPLTYAGAYDATRTYIPREVVTSAGSVFMAIALTSGHAPPDATYWLPMGSSGAVLYESTAAAGPPTDGSVFWYVTDETC